jgi:hypothetical protein
MKPEPSRLAQSLTPIELQVLRHALRKLKAAGDLPGHEFHGNQWTDAAGGTHEERRTGERATEVFRRASDAPRIIEHIEHGRVARATPQVAATAIEQMASHTNHANLQMLQAEGEANKNIYGPHATELKRGEMPQLPEEKDGQMAFLQHLHANGVEMKIIDVDPRELMATQAELDSVKVGQIYKYLLQHEGKLRGETGPLFVSKELNIIDGHHRWASVAAYALTHPGVRVPVAVLNVPIKRALELSEQFDVKRGIEHKTFAAPMKAAAGKNNDGFAPIDLTPPPPDAPPPPDTIHPWNWVNGRWIWIPTDTADGVPPTLDLPEKKARALGDVEGHPFHGNQWTNGVGGGRDAAVPKGDRQAREEWIRSLTEDERNGIKDFVGPNGVYAPVNEYLRGKANPLDLRSENDPIITNIDTALAKSHNTVEQTLYRGVGRGFDTTVLEPGFEWIDKGYVSTSLDRQHVLDYFITGDPVILELHTTKGAYIQDVVGRTEIRDKQVDEREWLLPRGLKFHVDTVEERNGPNGKLRHVKVSV